MSITQTTFLPYKSVSGRDFIHFLYGYYPFSYHQNHSSFYGVVLNRWVFLLTVVIGIPRPEGSKYIASPLREKGKIKHYDCKEALSLRSLGMTRGERLLEWRKIGFGGRDG
jgi:hypothetical protein